MKMVVATLALVLVTAGTSVASEPELMEDPIFGIQYKPSEAVFEKAPAEITKSCALEFMLNLWVYARWKAKDSDYMLVSGFLEIEADEFRAAGQVPPIEPHLTGIVVALSNGQCRSGVPEAALVGEVVETRKGKSVFLPEQARRELSNDLLRRYAKAFGGQERFLKRIKYPNVGFDLPPPLATALAEFAKTK